MLNDIIGRLLTLVLLCLVQTLVLNHVHLFDCATPLLYVAFVLVFPRNYPRWAILVWSFALGFVVDIFSNTAGVASGAMTLLGFIQPYFVEMFARRDDTGDMVPSLRTMGFGKFGLFSLVLVFIYCLTFITLEQFSFFNWQHWSLCVGGSTLLTVVLIMAIESVRRRG